MGLAFDELGFAEPDKKMRSNVMMTFAAGGFFDHAEAIHRSPVVPFTLLMRFERFLYLETVPVESSDLFRMVMCDDDDGYVEKAADLLNALGYDNLWKLDGGLSAWALDGGASGVSCTI